VTIALPPLRERSPDIPELVAHFLQRYAAENGTPTQAMMPETLKFLQTQRWPGNVRELGNTVRKAMLQARGRTITLEDVQRVLNEKHTASPPSAPQQPMREYIAQLLGAAQRGEVDHVHAAFFAAAEKELLTQAMELAGGNKTKAAQWLGMTRLTLREKLAALESG
jgi:DNA-binding NtrC family response regulator